MCLQPFEFFFARLVPRQVGEHCQAPNGDRIPTAAHLQTGKGAAKFFPLSITTPSVTKLRTVNTFDNRTTHIRRQC